MGNWALLRIMTLKEIRTTFRERAQLRGLIVSVVVMFVVLCGTFTSGRRHPVAPSPASQIAAASAVSAAAERWVAIGICAGASFLFSLGYLISATLSCFVGEKEGRTLEILLASPLSDRRLFYLKAGSVLFPSAAVGCLFAGMLAAILIGMQILAPSGMLIATTLICAPPLMMLAQLCVVGVGAALSVRAETMKGAAQGLSVIFLIVMFGGGYGIPMLVRQFPSLQAQIAAHVVEWLQLPFAKQYVEVAGVLAIVASICIRIGRALFKRDRMLT